MYLNFLNIIKIYAHFCHINSNHQILSNSENYWANNFLGLKKKQKIKKINLLKFYFLNKININLYFLFIFFAPEAKNILYQVALFFHYPSPIFRLY